MGKARAGKLGAAAWVACVLLACAGATLLLAISLPQSSANADSGFAAGAQSAEGFDGGTSQMQDYGWLYREGDCWYAKQPLDYEHNEDGSNQAQFILADDGFVYEYYRNYLHWRLDRFRVPVESYYTNGANWKSDAGEIVYQQGYHVDIGKLAGSTRNETIRRYVVPTVWADIYGNSGLDSPLNNLFARPGASYRLEGLRLSYYLNGLPYLENRGVVRKVTFEDNFEQCFEAPPAEDERPVSPSGQPCEYEQLHLYYIDGWFKDFINLTEINGLQYVRTSETLSMAHMFDGCLQLANLDLSSFDTSNCNDFTGMFDGCNALETLSFGDGWTQGAADSSKRATFPVAMRSGEGADEVEYAAGEVIPDGAATYTVDKVNIGTGTLSLKSRGNFVAVPASFSYDYSGSAIEPAVKLEVDGVQLTEGEDFAVRYIDNTKCGTAHALVTGKGDYFGSFVVEFDIVDQAVGVFADLALRLRAV